MERGIRRAFSAINDGGSELPEKIVVWLKEQQFFLENAMKKERRQ